MPPPPNIYPITLTRSDSRTAIRHFWGAPLRLQISSEWDLTGLTELRAEIYDKRLTDSSVQRLAVAWAQGPAGYTAVIDFSAGQTKLPMRGQRTVPFFLTVRAVLPNGSPDVYELGMVEMVANPSSDQAPPQPQEQIYATTFSVAAERGARLSGNLPDAHPQLDAQGGLERGISERIAGLAAGPGTMDLFTGGIRNAGCWAADVDVTCLAVWNSQYSDQIGATAITARHVAICHHAVIANGSTIRWRAANGAIVSRTLTNSVRVGTTDLRIGLLDSALPDTITPAMLLPADYTSWIDVADKLVCYTNQLHQLAVGQVSASHQLSVPADAHASGYYASVLTGDSGNAWGLIMGGRFVAVGLFFGPTTSSAWLPDQLAGIGTAMTSLGVSLPLTYYPFRHTVHWRSLRGVPAFGSAALLNPGTAAGNLVQLEAGGTLPPSVIPPSSFGLTYTTSGSGALVGRVIRADANPAAVDGSAWLALAPSGANGFVMLSVPQAGVTNQAGAGAVDLQLVRSAATQVAAAAASFAAGRNNAISSTTSTGSQFVATAGWIPGGDGAICRNPGSYAWASGGIATSGDLQTSGHLLGAQTVDATPVVMSRLGINDIAQFRQRAVTYRGTLTARSTSGLVKVWDIALTMVTTNSTGSTVILSPVTTVAAASAGTDAWAVALMNNGFALRLVVTGDESLTIRWGLRLEAVEVG